MTKFIKCEQCRADVSEDECDFAALTRTIKGEEHLFCCAQCVERYLKAASKKEERIG